MDLNKVVDRLAELADKNVSPEEAFRQLGQEFPLLTVGEFKTVGAFLCARTKALARGYEAEAAAMEKLHDLVKPVFDDGRAETIGQAIDILAGEGNETAKAIRASWEREAA
jgi:hypothetical protein